MKYVLAFLIAISSLWSVAQTGRQHRPLYDLGGGNYLNKGWFIGAGATYMLATPGRHNELILNTERTTSDTLLAGEYHAKGRIGLYVEIGKFHFFEYPYLIDYIDYGLAYKALKGNEEFVGRANLNGVMTDITQLGEFNDGFVGLFFNANHIHQVSDRSFLQLGLGINAEYKLLDRSTFDGVSALSSHEVHPPLNIQGHVKLSYGLRAESGLFIVPSIETPIINAYPFENGKSSMGYFNSRYRPLIVSVRFMFWKKRKAADCVGSPKGKRGEQLWDKDMRRKYKR